MTGLDNLPEIPAGEMERERFKFPQYLMFNTIKRGVRRYLCTCCGERFEHDSTSLRMLDTPEDRAWDVIKVNDRAVCPACGCVSLVKNRKTFTPKWYCDAVVYLIPVTEDHVVARCVMYEKYGSGAVGDEAKIRRTETNVYHLRRGQPTQFFRWYGREFHEEKFREPFLWTHGLWTEKYGYREVWVGEESGRLAQDQTFLKYFPRGILDQHMMYRVCGSQMLMRYLSAYAEYPQAFETLCKVGMFEPVDELAEGRKNVRIMDWTAKTPWGMMRMDKQSYEELCRKKWDIMDTRRIFRAIGDRGVKDMEKARDISIKAGHVRYRCTISDIYDDIKAGRRYNGKPDGLYTYIGKIVDKEQGACSRGYVNAAQIMDTWLDYLRMVEKAGMKGKAPEFPPNLAERHQQMIELTRKEEKKKKRADAEKAAAEAAKRRAEINAKYPEVSARYAKIAGRYAFEDETYMIVVPEGAADIVEEGRALCHCTGYTERYFGRIASGESFIFFLRKKSEPKKSWYTLEVEPGGTIRQKRTMMNEQEDDLNAAVPFLRKWQEAIRPKMTEEDMAEAMRAKKLRIMEFEELERTGAIVRNGSERGKRLCDVLSGDLMEALYEIKTAGAVGEERKEA